MVKKIGTLLLFLFCSIFGGTPFIKLKTVEERKKIVIPAYAPPIENRTLHIAVVKRMAERKKNNLEALRRKIAFLLFCIGREREGAVKLKRSLLNRLTCGLWGKKESVELPIYIPSLCKDVINKITHYAAASARRSIELHKIETINQILESSSYDDSSSDEEFYFD